MDENKDIPSLPAGGASQDWAIWTPPGLTAGDGSTPPTDSTTPAPRPNRRRQVAVVAAGMVAAALVGGAAGHVAWPGGEDHETEAAQAVPMSPSGDAGGQYAPGNDGGTASNGATSAAQAKVAAKVSPALVDINTDLGYQSSSAAGTGVVLTSDGTILTNNHVIRGATKISATDVGNGKTYNALVVGYDRSHDIAVIKLVGASGLATADLGDSSSASVGQAVLGIGNAGGQGGTPHVAAGTITGLGRSITASDESNGDAEKLSGLIATNAPIQPGDSGGALVDMDGQVLGIDTAASASYSFSNAASQGFAVPINDAMRIVKQITAGTASSTVHIGQTAFLGVQVQNASSSIDGSAAATGVAVVGSVPGSPAAAAGIGQGSTITAVNGVTVSSPTELTNQLSSRHPGDKVTIAWTGSDGKSTSSSIVLAKGPAA
jgi:S1-C subfamily serine protease